MHAWLFILSLEFILWDSLFLYAVGIFRSRLIFVMETNYLLEIACGLPEAFKPGVGLS